jgi:hypothetical protein
MESTILLIGNEYVAVTFKQLGILWRKVDGGTTYRCGNDDCEEAGCFRSKVYFETERFDEMRTADSFLAIYGVELTAGFAVGKGIKL